MISGIKESILSSRAIQIMSQCDAERAIKVLKTKVNENKEI